ncbi:alpha/beta fold hydrolase [Roseospira marina]|uniref:Alpha/beta fold hydrolase n=1 Tax=Roseospira marina TaxID=140057 RepID=A0A5M6IAQ0_9PROT|nr:alpha/beta fold hydrolase BchO [Roseospira marina]KAA5604805.1 alpha/beta fold hydrolase [Roseospira marina]MBB4313496.1 magnesium chelatase accessory protein [Roseospira marina]MBB5086658.1 magnesium chelatase accessory protein [Roseospira marina]
MVFRAHRPDWDTVGHDWPNREHSRFLLAHGFRWHVQVAGQGPVLLLLHGTGASTHSFRDLLPRLAERFTVIVPDLPGHGFTANPPASSFTLPGMGRSVAALLRELKVKPALAVGHSAGAAILIRMALDRHIHPKAIISLNGALLPFKGSSGHWWSGLAKLLLMNPLVPRLFAWSAVDQSRVETLIRDTGSEIDARGLELYGRLFKEPAHVGGALAMMANWDLRALRDLVARLDMPLDLVVGERDATVKPADAEMIAARAPNAHVRMLPGLGHLAHEERPDVLATLIVDLAQAHGVLTG